MSFPTTRSTKTTMVTKPRPPPEVATSEPENPTKHTDAELIPMVTIHESKEYGSVQNQSTTNLSKESNCVEETASCSTSSPSDAIQSSSQDAAVKNDSENLPEGACGFSNATIVSEGNLTDWNCKMCTVLNDKTLYECHICDTPKDAKNYLKTEIDQCIRLFKITGIRGSAGTSVRNQNSKGGTKSKGPFPPYEFMGKSKSEDPDRTFGYVDFNPTAASVRKQAFESVRALKLCNGFCFLGCTSFAITRETEELPLKLQDALFVDILNCAVQDELEDKFIINWSPEVADTLHSRLFALWNRTSGDCLLDSVFQATWGVFDLGNDLRWLMFETLQQSSERYYLRWLESEKMLGKSFNFIPSDKQCLADYDKLLAIAATPGCSLEQIHVFVLAQIFRRPIIVYGVHVVKTYYNEKEDLGLVRYEGIYLPFFCDQAQCSKSPIALAYTRSHFSALIPYQPPQDSSASGTNTIIGSVYLPLVTYQGTVLPIHFLNELQVGTEDELLKTWLDVSHTPSGIMVASLSIPKPDPLVHKMMDEWLANFRKARQFYDDDDDDD